MAQQSKIDILKAKIERLKAKGEGMPKRCCLCEKAFIGYGNNPAPLNGDTCCDACNATVVIPARLAMIHNTPPIEQMD
jgi:hypothetical protein